MGLSLLAIVLLLHYRNCFAPTIIAMVDVLTFEIYLGKFIRSIDVRAGDAKTFTWAISSGRGLASKWGCFLFSTRDRKNHIRDDEASSKTINNDIVP